MRRERFLLEDSEATTAGSPSYNIRLIALFYVIQQVVQKVREKSLVTLLLILIHFENADSPFWGSTAWACRSYEVLWQEVEASDALQKRARLQNERTSNGANVLVRRLPNSK